MFSSIDPDLVAEWRDNPVTKAFVAGLYERMARAGEEIFSAIGTPLAHEIKGQRIEIEEIIDTIKNAWKGGA